MKGGSAIQFPEKYDAPYKWTKAITQFHKLLHNIPLEAFKAFIKQTQKEYPDLVQFDNGKLKLNIDKIDISQEVTTDKKQESNLSQLINQTQTLEKIIIILEEAIKSNPVTEKLEINGKKES